MTTSAAGADHVPSLRAILPPWVNVDPLTAEVQETWSSPASSSSSPAALTAESEWVLGESAISLRDILPSWIVVTSSPASLIPECVAPDSVALDSVAPASATVEPQPLTIQATDYDADYASDYAGDHVTDHASDGASDRAIEEPVAPPARLEIPPPDDDLPPWAANAVSRLSFAPTAPPTLHRHAQARRDDEAAISWAALVASPAAVPRSPAREPDVSDVSVEDRES